MIGKTLRTQDGKIIDIAKKYSHYLSLALADEYEIPVVLWLDYDEKKQKEVLVHSFSIIGGQVFYDALGFFSDIKERENLYPHTYKNLVFCKNVYEARERLKELKVPHTNLEIKKAAREKVRTQWLNMNIEINGIMYSIVYWAESTFMGRPVILFFQMSESGHISKLIHKITIEQFQSTKKQDLKFVDRKEYVGLGTGEILRKL